MNNTTINKELKDSGWATFRISRTSYFVAMLFVGALSKFAIYISEGAEGIHLVIVLVALVLALCLSVCRARDIGKRDWWALLMFVPAACLYLFFKETKEN